MEFKIPASVIVNNLDKVLEFLRMILPFTGAPAILQSAIHLMERAIKFPMLKPYIERKLKETGLFSATEGAAAPTVEEELAAEGIDVPSEATEGLAEMIQDTQRIFGCDNCPDGECSDPTTQS